MEIDRQEIIDQLRGRDEDEVADRAEQELPEQVDTDEHAALLKANFKEPGRGKVIASYMGMSHDEAEARLDKVTAPVLVIMGTADIDWPDPAAEAEWVAGRLDGKVVMLDGAGHHPHVEFPAEVTEAVRTFDAGL